MPTVSPVGIINLNGRAANKAARPLSVLSDRGEKYIKIAEGIDAGNLALICVLPQIARHGRTHG